MVTDSEEQQPVRIILTSYQSLIAMSTMANHSGGYIVVANLIINGRQWIQVEKDQSEKVTGDEKRNMPAQVG